MTFLEAYAKFGPDTMAIAKALDIPEQESDMLINARMNREYLRSQAEYLRSAGRQQFEPSNAPRKPVRFAGYDETEKSWW
ncbi:hypothetical protein GOE05_24155 [Sinorhizobium medicae]|uniref:hypothetical protein n=1 Tax=Sinorhizobium medicae TaxID=110321 RepID=UPI00299EDBF0|nr:hypothetical protein [Sinorhizobium medicae]MDX0930566.1 hypothetical protein [Sinorhizobium medicae]WQO57165.1 hypothetical protein U8C35_10565 [Sinorhizobium medicae]